MNDHLVILRCKSAHAPILRSSASIDSSSFIFCATNVRYQRPSASNARHALETLSRGSLEPAGSATSSSKSPTRYSSDTAKTNSDCDVAQKRCATEVVAVSKTALFPNQERIAHPTNRIRCTWRVRADVIRNDVRESAGE